ncbi:SAP domain-containing protein [Artemisia annua]|uniref:SAP domain-containing protein n=1 Tax=Artemisia annua TaxID=35608 RepID=A0A2U1L983_ARTAN|nr:SAP domain-containing protein [Artemisia annua]
MPCQKIHCLQRVNNMFQPNSLFHFQPLNHTLTFPNPPSKRSQNQAITYHIFQPFQIVIIESPEIKQPHLYKFLQLIDVYVFSRFLSVPVEVDEDAEVAMPEFDVTDQKSGQVEKLKVEQCKLYLRKHGLRLTDKKDVLGRIKEHISIVNGEGELKYRASSFVMNFKGVIKYGRKLLGATDPQISEPEPSWVIWLLLNGMSYLNKQLPYNLNSIGVCFLVAY